MESSRLSQPLYGGCACGAIRYALGAPPFDTGWCHCRRCQRTSGAPAIAFTTVARKDFDFCSGRDQLRTWRSTSFGRRGFCGTCGTLLTIEVDFQPETIDVAAVTLDEPSGVAPGFHLFCDEAISWARFDDGLPRFARFRPDTRGLAAGATSPDDGGIRSAGRSAMATKSPQILNALDLLTEQHQQVDRLFAQLEAGQGDGATFLQLADALAAHATIEEKIFYPRVMAEQTSELLHESVEEHLAIKRVLADMLTMDLESKEFEAKLSVLKEEVSHHAHEEEEAKLFPILRKSMTADELAGIGNDLLAMFEELMKSSPRLQVPKETRDSAPLPA
jgi:iron-sulfur cluster repair protein YtfE (RIC family)